MNIVFMGTPDFAVPTLQMLINEKHNIQLVITQPDRPKGRGNTLTMSPVKELAVKYDLEVRQPERIKQDEELYEYLKKLSPDLIVVVAFGQILPESILNIPKLGCINIHGSLLPRYRGAAPIQWSIINDEQVTGVTIMYMDKGMDTGDIIYKKEIPILPNETATSLYNKMMYIGADALKEALPLIEAGGKLREVQNHSAATYAPIITKSLGEIDWSQSAEAIDCLVRGVESWPGAYTYYDSQPIKVFNLNILNRNYPPEETGVILDIDDGLVVQTSRAQILIKEIQMPNKKRMPVMEYLKGNTISVGDKLGI
ncbi:methionyl-tRNA formyltransferase [Candidatus Epulonipiscium fishelsonii]|uniref:Methionyl-tRNA formyltransferase n=1 Tax=Candidatus Epulonipiscium fishelsonii TaxID=77094 RepID=A0ACC8XDV7_9FIRM|nr:methionyl-tRNA formyltransferase [Epulopiscium sp. SCG-B05WGA-EpuloA1]ONI41096.1 methionyl-tRNA formyltransferase [Epulopiscium sp. SCG-B11WGA-EpuloA1]